MRSQPVLTNNTTFPAPTGPTTAIRGASFMLGGHMIRTHNDRYVAHLVDREADIREYQLVRFHGP